MTPGESEIRTILFPRQGIPTPVPTAGTGSVLGSPCVHVRLSGSGHLVASPTSLHLTHLYVGLGSARAHARARPHRSRENEFTDGRGLTSFT